ncbi:hypothetical protein ACN68I_07285 [Aerococcus viridans]|uniref:hypothetical protein n=1 Tax=Aerococcus viridans TaxID=1377 RepID=UPI003B20E5FC
MKPETIEKRIQAVQNRIEKNEAKLAEDKALLKELEQEKFAIKGKEIFKTLQEMGATEDDLESALMKIAEQSYKEQGVDNNDQNNY